MTNGRARWTIAALVVVLGAAALPATGARAAESAAPATVRGGLVPSATSDLVSTRQAQPHAGGLCAAGSCYYYASVGALGATTSGVSANFSQSRPRVAAQDRYSGAMVSVGTSDGKQALEFGWWVSKSAFNDSVPHLAFNPIVDGTPLCLNTCGFVALSKVPHGGSGVAIGKLGTYTIKLVKSRWVLVYNGTVIGYYPTSLWKGKLNRSRFDGAFGVVAAASPTTPQSQMGNGVIGTSPASARMVAFKMINTVGAPQFSYLSLNAPSTYKVGLYKPGCKSSCDMHFGGPGF